MWSDIARITSATLWAQTPLIGSKQMSLEKDMDDLAPLGSISPPPPVDPAEGRGQIVDIVV